VAPAPAAYVVPAPPPKDDGTSAQGTGSGGAAHASALEELKLGPLYGVIDRQRSIRILVPDAPHWTRVKFFGIPTVLGLRYGKEHHAVIGITVQEVPEGAPISACAKAFEDWGEPWLDTFGVDVARDPPKPFTWRAGQGEVHTSYARTASVMMRDGFAVAYAVYPAWKGACVVAGIAVPARDDEARARAVRDRFAEDVLPRLMVLSREAPKGRE
jgi:hypothetical protein